MLNDLIRIMREMTKYTAQAKVREREDRYKKNFILRAKKWSQIKHLQTRYNNTKHK
jgi:hypothetical protein